jgi:hypothetical protein
MVWEKKIDWDGDDFATDITDDKDGFVVAGSCGRSDFFQKANMAILKVDDKGQELWKKALHESGMEGAQRIYLDDRGGYVVAGNRIGRGISALVRRTDKSGILLGSLKLEGIECRGACKAKNNSIVVVGGKRLLGSSEQMLVILKIGLFGE